MRCLLGCFSLLVRVNLARRLVCVLCLSSLLSEFCVRFVSCDFISSDFQRLVHPVFDGLYSASSLCWDEELIFVIFRGMARSTTFRDGKRGQVRPFESESQGRGFLLELRHVMRTGNPRPRPMMSYSAGRNDSRTSNEPSDS